MIEVIVPSITSNEDTVCLIEILVDKNEVCKSGDIICILESTKTIFELMAEHKGHVWFVLSAGNNVKTDQVIAFISDEAIDEAKINAMSYEEKTKEIEPIVTKKAQTILDKHKIDPYDIKKDGVIKASDVQKHLKKDNKLKQDNDIYDDFKKIMKSYAVGSADLKDLVHLKQTLSLAQKIYDDKWDKKVPAIDALFDRWSAGEIYGFGEKTNISHLSYVTGDVTVGDQTFIGPFTIIDGSGGLEIGSYCSIAAGVHIYSHDTIARALSGYKVDVKRASTIIGNCCFIGPNSVITKGINIGDHCFVGANSVVTFDLDSNTAVSGNPAQIIGKVIIEKDGSVLIRIENNDN